MAAELIIIKVLKKYLLSIFIKDNFSKIDLLIIESFFIE